MVAILTAAAASAGVMIAATVSSALSVNVHATMLSWSGKAAASGRTSATQNVNTRGSAGRRLGLPAKSDSAPSPTTPLPTTPPVLTARDVRLCPAAATACVDLSGRLTWLQSGGTVTFGPVRVEPGPPGSAHATPRGTLTPC